MKWLFLRSSSTLGRRRGISFYVTGVLLMLVVLVPAAETQRLRAQAARGKNGLQTFQKKHYELHGKLTSSLEELAKSCDAKQLTKAAARIRMRAVPIDTQALRVQVLPRQVQPKIPAGLSIDERYWRVQLRHLQRGYAKDLYLLSRRALNAGFPSYAYHLVREVARHDPDHNSARRLLGFVRQGKGWGTPFAASMMRRRFVWHDRFGWLPRTHVARYEKGERYFKRRWISVSKEAELRRDFQNAWEIRSDHYLVKTNHSLERGVEVAMALEKFYSFFIQTFAGFFNSREQMKKLFEGGSSRTTSSRARPYEVHYYRTRREYNERLASKIPQIAITNGLYYTGDRVAYFFHDERENNESTLYHEASHQLFYESTSRDRAVAENRNFWIVEGISCYLESFRHQDGGLSLGDPRYIRFRNARDRYLTDRYGEKFFVPLARFSSMGMREFQTDPNLSANYSQAAGLAHFFMHHAGGRYREALIEHLSQLYRANPRRLHVVQSLEELTGVDSAELDRQYGRYLKVMQETVKGQSR